MTDIILILSFAAMAVLGYFLMSKFDKFLEENRKAIAREQAAIKNKAKPYIIIGDDIESDIAKSKIKNFRKEHSCIKVIVCDPSETDYIDLYNLRKDA